MPTSPKVKEALWHILPEKAEGKIIDLGSGWGTLAFPIAKKYSSSQVIGYENSPLPFLFCKIRQLLQPAPNLTFIFKNFYNISLEDAGLIICYLYPGAMEQLDKKFRTELKPGTWIISHTFAIPGWQPVKVMHAEDIYHTAIYLYKI